MVYEVMRRNKKSKYKYATINKKRYYFYTIRWVDICGDAGHATKEEFDKFEPAYMVSHAYVYKRTNKYLYTFSSYDEKEEVGDGCCREWGRIEHRRKFPKFAQQPRIT